jgi:hypothetical protein
MRVRSISILVLLYVAVDCSSFQRGVALIGAAHVLAGRAEHCKYRFRRRLPFFRFFFFLGVVSLSRNNTVQVVYRGVYLHRYQGATTTMVGTWDFHPKMFSISCLNRCRERKRVVMIYARSRWAGKYFTNVHNNDSPPFFLFFVPLFFKNQMAAPSNIFKLFGAL